MRVLAGSQDRDHRLTRRIAAWDSAAARRLSPTVEAAAEHTKVWWAAAVLMAAAGGWRGRRAAAAGVLAMAVAEVLSNGIRAHRRRCAALAMGRSHVHGPHRAGGRRAGPQQRPTPPTWRRVP
ncbi:hypothetical protein GCM10010302_06800 [Streptomyces polychromogenes]|uniref:Uncharacterized protein n=1 Tax=Streptomyces polychromogenes TaxID=67342 RepID=A0ABN0V2K5_9ACTN